MTQRFTFPGLRPPIPRGFMARAQSGAPVVPPPPPVLTSIEARGWSGVWAGGVPPTFQPDSAPVLQAVTRQGFDATGAATSFTDQLVFTSRVRFPRDPGGTTITPDIVALSDYVYVGDAVTGVANNSAMRSPKPIVQWVTGHRDLFQRFLVAEIVAAHRDARQGRQVAAVRFIATDGTNTVTQTVSNVVVSNRAGDIWALEVFRCNLDCQGLADGAIRLDVEVYPFCGADNADYALSSVFKSVNFTIASPNKLRGPCTRFYRKRAGGWPIAWVATGGSTSASNPGWRLDGNSGFPFGTLRAAVQAAFNAANTGVTGSVLEGEVRFGAGTWTLQGDTVDRQGGVGALLLTRDPGAARADVILQFGSAAYSALMLAPAGRPEAVGIIIRDVTLRRTGTGVIGANSGTRPLELWLDNMVYDTQGTTTIITSGGTVGLVTGMSVINSAAGGAVAQTSLASSGATQCWALLRGVLGTQGATTIDAHNVHSCRFNSFRSLTFNAMGEGESGGMVNRSQFYAPNVTTGTAYFILADGGGSAFVNGFYLANCLFEPFTDPTVDPGIRIGSDLTTDSTRHFIIENIVNTGAGSSKRCNWSYTDGAVNRTHDLWSVRGVISNQVNLKADLFSSDGTRIGNWSNLYGVGWRGVVCQFLEANGGSLSSGGFRLFAPEYLGLGSQRAASLDDGLNLGITDWRGLTRVAGATSDGTGGGTYTLTGGSICRGRVAIAHRSFDVTGAAVPAPDNAGLYA